MTDMAPPAHTPLTPQNRAIRALAGSWTLSVEIRVEREIREAETAARAEGRLAGLMEAAQEAVRLSSWGGYSDAPNIARRIRGLAADVPKAPKTPSDPDLR